MSPSFLPWWGWILAALVTFLFAYGALDLAKTSDGGRGQFGCACLSIALAVTAFLSAVVGLVQVVKWAWNGS